MFLVNWHHETSEDLEGVYWKTYRKLLVPNEIFDWFCHLALNQTNSFSLQLINLMRSYSCLPQCLEWSRVSMQLIFSDFETGCNWRTSHGRRTVRLGTRPVQRGKPETTCVWGWMFAYNMSQLQQLEVHHLEWMEWQKSIRSSDWDHHAWYVLRGCHIPD